MRIYKHLGGYKLKFDLSVGIETEGDSQYVYFLAPLHVNKKVKLTFSFSMEFNDWEILNDRDVMTKFINMYGHEALSTY